MTFVRWSFCQPDFNTEVELHHFIDTIQEASNQGREVAVG